LQKRKGACMTFLFLNVDIFNIYIQKRKEKLSPEAFHAGASITFLFLNVDIENIYIQKRKEKLSPAAS
jgi:hypothetical protein